MDNQTEISNPTQDTHPENLHQNIPVHNSSSNVAPNNSTVTLDSNYNYYYGPVPDNNPSQNYNQGYITNPNYSQNGFLQQQVNLDSLTGWMKFLGIFTIVLGALTCLGIITAAIGVPMILAGIGLVNASKSLREFKDLNNQFTLNQFFNYLNKFFKINGILAIIYIVIAVLYIAFLLVFIILSVYSYTSY